VNLLLPRAKDEAARRLVRMMESIGSILRKRRLERSLSLEEAHQATKITLQNLAALEDDHFESFANRVYARAFLRDYANYLGLDSGELLERYESEWGPKDHQPAVVYQRRLRGGLIWKLLALLIVAGAIGDFFIADYPPVKAARARVYSWAGGRFDHQLVRHPAPAPPKPKPEPPPSPVVPAASVEAPPKPSHALTLVVSTTAQAWLRVQVDGAKQFEGIMPANQTRTWSADRAIRIRTGNAGALKLTLNGKELGAMGPPVQIRERVFSAE
jgi:cytoskeletal protein RodZ